MEESSTDHQNTANHLIEYAANLLIQEKKSASETKKALMDMGLDAENAETIVSSLEEQIQQAKNEAANKNMLYGALWFLGGVGATAAEIGYVFWGAIVYGGFLFLKGLLRF